jgi:proteasome lid subunit RPN8/RPN11
VIAIPGGCISRIVAAAQQAYPEECCGLLIGRRMTADDLRVTAVAESTNVAPALRNRRFEVDPALRLALMRALRGSDETIVGHYHSHPDGRAEPSAHDAAMAFEPDLLWLIVAAAAGGIGDVRCWSWDGEDGRFRRVPHRIET